MSKLVVKAAARPCRRRQLNQPPRKLFPSRKWTPAQLSASALKLHTSVQRRKTQQGIGLPSDWMGAARNEKLVLLVDQDEESRHVYSSWLMTQGFETLMTPRGRVALWLLQRYQPAFILTQEQLRDMSALDLLHRIRSRSSTAQLPLIVLCKSIGRRQEFWLAGAAAVVPSLGFEDLRRVLHTALSHVNRHAN